VWRDLLGPRGVVLCLRGRAIRRRSPEYGFYFPDHLELEREFVAAMARLTRAHPKLVDPERSLYAGYSQGAQMGMLMLLERGRQVPRLLLVEGGAGDWTLPRVLRFKRSGGERVAILCGTPGCQQRATASVTRLENAGLRSYAHYVPGGGHTYGGSMLPELRKAFAELTEDDARWQP
jgi:predicted esterase